MDFPPYDGQGTRLPKSSGFTGQWVIKNEIFLFVPPPSDFVSGIKVRPDYRCAGFNVEALANASGASVAEFFSANQAQELSVTWQKIPPQAQGADYTNLFTFRLPDGREAIAPVHVASAAGNA